MNFCSTLAANTASNEKLFALSLSLDFGFRTTMRPRLGSASAAITLPLRSSSPDMGRIRTTTLTLSFLSAMMDGRLNEKWGASEFIIKNCLFTASYSPAQWAPMLLLLLSSQPLLLLLLLHTLFVLAHNPLYACTASSVRIRTARGRVRYVRYRTLLGFRRY